jgi:predicted DNA-binding transcriptional regulator AlpA
LDQSKATLISRQVHRWYRVVGVTGEDTFPRLIRVSGKPWAWTEGEIEDLKQRNLALPSVPPPPGMIETQAALLKDVVHVYERQVELK